MNPIVKVVSHPRAGTHFLEACLYYTFYNDGKRDLSSPSWSERGHWRNGFRQRDEMKYGERKKWGKLGTSHPMFSEKYLEHEKLIYIVRDGRDNVLSLWRTKPMMPSAWKDISLSDFLREKIDWHPAPVYKATDEWKDKYNVIEHWLLHVESWWKERPKNTFFVQYERLVLNPGKVLKEIEEHFELKSIDGYRVPDGLIGFVPVEGKVGRWKDYFSSEDLELFFSIVPKDYWGLWRKNEKCI